MDNKTVIFHLSSKYIDKITKELVIENNYIEPFILNSQLPKRYKKLNLKTIDNNLYFNNYNINYISPTTINLLKIPGIDVLIIYDVYNLFNNDNSIRPIIKEYPELEYAYEIYFVDKYNVLMYNHNIYVEDLLQISGKKFNTKIKLILNRFIATIGIPTISSTKSARN